MAKGPFIQVATFCESVTRDPERGSMTIHNCVTLILATKPTGPPPSGAVVSVSIAELILAVSMWSGDLDGERQLTIRPEPPTGSMSDISSKVKFGGGATGFDLRFKIAEGLVHEGVYWFSVLIAGGPTNEDERLVARIPLELRFEDSPVGLAFGGGAGGTAV